MNLPNEPKTPSGRNTLRQMPFPMPRIMTWFGGCALVCLAGAAAPAQTISGPAGQLTYQGFLSGTNGGPLATNGAQNFVVQFRLYNDRTAGQSANILWGEQQTVTVERGVFSARLGAGTALAGVNFTNNLAGFFNAADASNRFVGATVLGVVPGDPEIAPRLQLLSAPYALLAQTALTANTAYLATNAAFAPSAAYAGAATAAAYATNATYATNVTYAAYATNLAANASFGPWNSGAGFYYVTNNVGVGTNAPDCALTVVGSQGIYGDEPYFLMFGGPNSGYAQAGAGIANASGHFATWANPNDGVIRALNGRFFLNNLSGSPGVCITSQYSTANRIGIGTAAPGFPFVVNGCANINTVNQFEYINSGGWGFGGPVTYCYSVAVSAAILVTGELDVFSDARIKNIVGVSDAARDLRTLNGLRVTDYVYKDTANHGSHPYKKLIAQQVETVYPQAVHQKPGAVPDVYQYANAQHGWIALDAGLKVGEKVQIAHQANGSAVHTVRDVRPGAFQIDADLTEEHVFVFGRQVDDLRTVDYDAIAMLNVSANQELARTLLAEENELAGLEKEFASLQAREQNRTARLALLEHRISSRAARAVPASLSTGGRE